MCRLPEFYVTDDGMTKDFKEVRIKCLFYILEKEPQCLKWRMLEIERPKLKAIDCASQECMIKPYLKAVIVITWVRNSFESKQVKLRKPVIN